VSAPRGGLLLLCLASLLLPACGKKGPPVAPERRLPAAASGLQGAVEEQTIVLQWVNPRTRVDGTALRDLTLVRLHRREEADGAPLKPALLSGGEVVGYTETAVIRLAQPSPAVVERGQVRWVDRAGLTFGRRYVYVVTAEDSAGRSSAPSERLAVTYLAAPEAPGVVTVRAGDRQVELTWTPPERFIDGTPAAGEVRYVVLRGPEEAGPLTPVTPAPVAGTAFTDTGLENDVTYRYAVRAVRVDPRGTATGPPAPALAATPVDTTPPSPPGNLVAVPSPGAVRLAWNPSPEEDVALYAVYRAVGAGDFVRIATLGAVSTVYTDRDVRPGATYRYAVTALDRARRANESARSNEARVTLPP
jgi:fibronectin type 3 domain-containing protein